MDQASNLGNHDILVVQLGARNHYAAPVTFYNNQMLRALYTDFYRKSTGVIGSALNFWNNLPPALQPPAVKRSMGRREVVIPDDYVKSFDIVGLLATLLLPIKKQFGLSHFMASLWGSSICILASRTAPQNIHCVYAFNGGALEIFQWARKHGIVCVLEQVSAPKAIEQQLLSNEYDKWHQWEQQTNSRFVKAFAMRERKEWALADYIVAPSEFVRSGLISEGVPETCIGVVPYGVNPSRYQSAKKQNTSDSHLNVLFVGAVNIHKGIQYLYEAVKDMPADKIHVKVAGGNYLTQFANSRLRERLELLDLVPRLEMPALYQWADVVVLPSVCEGSSLVTYEAMATGTPVITTVNAGSIVEHGMSGFVVQHGDPMAIRDYLLTLLREPELRQLMSHSARERIITYGSLAKYQDRLIHTVNSVLQGEAKQ